MKDWTAYFTSQAFFSTLIIAAIALIICIAVKRTFRKISHQMDKSNRMRYNLKTVSSVIRSVVFCFAILFVLQVNNVNVGALMTGLGIAGIVVAFAVQDLLKDLIMGIGIFIGNYFKVGDIVTYGNVEEGRVVSFTVKTTKIYDVNTGETLTVSNRNISEITRISDWLDVIVPGPYTVEAVRMREICEKIAERIRELEDVTDCVFLGTDEFAESLIKYRLRLFTDPAKKRPTKRAANAVIQDVFAENGIEVPFNQLDVHIKNA